MASDNPHHAPPDHRDTDHIKLDRAAYHAGALPAMQTPLFDVSHTRYVRAKAEELSELVLDANQMPRWVQQVFMRCEVINKGAPDGLGLCLRIHSKGWLPHSFLFNVSVIERVPHKTMALHVNGDFNGLGELSVEQVAPDLCRVHIRWRTDIRHPVLRFIARVIHPVLVANHTWAVDMATRMTRHEIDRRRAGGNDWSTREPTFRSYISFTDRWSRTRARQKGWVKFGNRRN